MARSPAPGARDRVIEGWPRNWATARDDDRIVLHELQLLAPVVDTLAVRCVSRLLLLQRRRQRDAGIALLGHKLPVPSNPETANGRVVLFGFGVACGLRSSP